VISSANTTELSLHIFCNADSIDDTFYKKAIVDLYSDNLFAAGTQMFSQYRAGLTEWVLWTIVSALKPRPENVYKTSDFLKPI